MPPCCFLRGGSNKINLTIYSQHHFVPQGHWLLWRPVNLPFLLRGSVLCILPKTRTTILIYMATTHISCDLYAVLKRSDLSFILASTCKSSPPNYIFVSLLAAGHLKQAPGATLSTSVEQVFSISKWVQPYQQNSKSHCQVKRFRS